MHFGKFSFLFWCLRITSQFFSFFRMILEYISNDSYLYAGQYLFLPRNVTAIIFTVVIYCTESLIKDKNHRDWSLFIVRRTQICIYKHIISLPIFSVGYKQLHSRNVKYPVCCQLAELKIPYMWKCSRHFLLSPFYMPGHWPAGGLF